MGKGDNRRPASVPDEEVARRWEATFLIPRLIKDAWQGTPLHCGCLIQGFGPRVLRAAEEGTITVRELMSCPQHGPPPEGEEESE